MPQPDARLRNWFTEACAWPDAVLPSYDGGSVANVAASVEQAFGVPIRSPQPPLAPDLLDPEVLRDARVVVLLVIDGYGALAHERRASQLGPVDGAAFSAGRITSVFPSTTAAALTSLQTGATPGQHGMAAYTLHLPSVGRVMNMVFLKPVDGSAFDEDAFDLASVLPTPTIYDRLRESGIEPIVVSHREYARSPLTRVHSGKTPYAGHRTLGEFVALLRREIERPGRRFIFAYWAGIDTLAHTWGPESDACLVEADLLDYVIRRHLLEPLAAGGGNVAVILTADHGHISIPESAATPLHDLTAVTGAWRRPNTGERRAVGLALPEPGACLRLRDVVGERAVVLAVDEAIDAGLYGPPPHHAELAERIGDTLLLARGPTSFPFQPARPDYTPSLGAHGSLTPEEMLVPLLVWRFGV